MSSMVDAIKATLIARTKTALASFFPALPSTNAAEYVGDRFDDGSPTAMAGQWYAAVHSVQSKEVNKLPGNSWVEEEWSALITITVRSAYAADSRIEHPKDLCDQMTRAVSSYFRNIPWDVMSAINTLFSADHALTNGLTIPFQVGDPLPQRQSRNPAFLKAIARKQTSQQSAFSATIRLSGARQLQAVGDIA